MANNKPRTEAQLAAARANLEHARAANAERGHAGQREGARNANAARRRNGEIRRAVGRSDAEAIAQGAHAPRVVPSAPPQARNTEPPPPEPASAPTPPPAAPEPAPAPEPPPPADAPKRSGGIVRRILFGRPSKG